MPRLRLVPVAMLIAGVSVAVSVSASVSVLAPARPAAATSVPPPITRPVPLASRPDVAAAFGTDLASFSIEAADALNRSTIERLGPLDADRAARLGRSAWFRPDDVALYAVPSTSGRRDEARRSRSWSVLAVPLHAVVRADGTVAPAPAPAAGLIDPTFSTSWGGEEYFTWAYFNVDDGGWTCPTTKGRIRGQWEYARLANVSPASRYDYWGFAERAVAEITQDASGCADAIDWFVAKMQSRTSGAYPVRQSPLTGSTSNCSTIELSVGGSFAGINASIRQPVRRCEKWNVSGGLAPSALEWYGVSYDNRTAWNNFQREAAALEIVRVPKGAGHGLNTKLDIDVDNR